MIPRRHFLGSLTTLGLAAGSTRIWSPKLFAAFPGADRPGQTEWKSQVIKAIPHNAAHRPPVVTGVSLQKSGELLAIVGDDHVTCMFDTRRQMFTEHLQQHTDWVRAVAFSPDGKMLATAGNDRQLMVWNVGQWDAPAYIKDHPEAIINLAFSRNGSRLATVGFDPWLRVFNVATGESQVTLELPCPDNHAVSFSADDSQIAAGGRNGVIRVFDTRNDSQVVQFPAHRQRIRSIDFTAGGEIVSGGDDQQVVITNPDNPTGARRLPRLGSKLYATALMDHDQLATAGSDNQIHIWRLFDLKQLGSLRGHTGTISCLDYQNKTLVSGSYDTTARLWTSKPVAAGQDRQTDLSNGWNPALK